MLAMCEALKLYVFPIRQIDVTQYPRAYGTYKSFEFSIYFHLANCLHLHIQEL